MTLEQQFKSVTEKNLGRIAELNDKVSANLKQANYYANVLRRSQQSLSTAKSKVFKDKVRLAEKYIKDVIGKTKVPTTWNAKRVKELRRVLASGSERTVADRCKKLAALRELQLYIDTFPLADRVADLVRKWTGCSDVEVCSPGNYDQTLKIKGHIVLEVHSRSREIYRNGTRKISGSNIRLYPTVTFIDYEDYDAEITDHWEMYCRKALLDPKFLVGFEEYEKWCGNGMPVVEYADCIREYGKFDGNVERYSSRLQYDFSDEALAAAIIINSVWMLPIGMCLDAAGRMPPKFGSILEEDLHSRFSHLFDEDNTTGGGVAKLDLINREVLCKSDADAQMAFDPDTCEMVHQALTWQHIPVGDVTIRDIHDYVAERVPWVKPYGTQVLTVDATTDIVKAAKEQGSELFIYPLRVGTDITDVQRKEKGKYEITVAYKIPPNEVLHECCRYGFNINKKLFKLYERQHERCGIFLSFEKD